MTNKTNTITEKEWNELYPQESVNFQVDTIMGKVRYVNLDNAATTIPFNSVKEAAESFLNAYGSIHRGAGQKSKISTEKFEKAREAIRNFVGASEQNYVIFTKNTTESINQAAAHWANIPGKVLVSDIEHSSNLLPWMKYNQIIQYKTSEDGTVILQEVEKVFREIKDIKLIVITGASNVTGYKTPIYKIAAIAHKNGAKILVDACQYIQHKKLNMLPDSDIEHIDFVAFSGHKMYAPYGAGVLVGPKQFFDKAIPYQIGGGNLPYITSDLKIKRFNNVRAHDPGTANAIGAVTIAESIKSLESLGYDRIECYEEALTNKAFEELKIIPQVKLHVKKENLGNVIAFDIIGFDHRLVAEILAQEYAIGVRAGSFCTYEFMRKIKRISQEQDKQIANEVENGITKNIPGLIRASFALSNNLEDVERFTRAVKEIALRGVGYYKNIYNQDSKTGIWERRSSTNVKPNELNYDSYSMEKYDQDIKNSIPGHDELHNKIVSFLQNDIKNKENLRVLELGVGTGLTADLILNNLLSSSYIGMDFSENMLNGAAKRLSNFPVTLIKGDFANTELPKNNDLIVSVIGIHHQETDEDKKTLFRKIYDALSNEGVFVFGDLVTYEDKEKAALNDALHFNYLVENAADEKSLKEWAYHHKFLNKLAPLEYQIAWLKEIGFNEVELAFNKFNTALILAKKSREVKNDF